MRTAVSSPQPARSSGSAFLSPTTRVFLGHCSTVRPVRFDWRPSTAPCRRTASTCLARWCSLPRGRRGAVGSIVNDFLAVAPWYRTGERSAHHRRTPGDFDAKHVLIRTATCLHGSVDILLNCEPSFDYGRVDAEWEYEGSTYDSVRTTNPDSTALTLTGDMRFGIEGRAVRARHRLTEGETSFAVLSWTDAPAPSSRAEVDTCRAETSRFWRDWIDGGRFPGSPVARVSSAQRADVEGPHLRPDRRAARRAHDVAARNLGGSRNWDYRFTWVRDAAFTLARAARAGL